MITSSASPASVTAAMRSSRHPRRVERVDPGPQLGVGVVPGLGDLDQPGAGVLLLGRRDGVLEVGQQHVDGRRDVGHLADHLRVVRRQEVDDPRRPERDVPHRLGRTDRQRAEEVLRGTHARRLRMLRVRSGKLRWPCIATAAPAGSPRCGSTCSGCSPLAVPAALGVPARRAQRRRQRRVLRRRRRRRRRRAHRPRTHRQALTIRVFAAIRVSLRGAPQDALARPRHSVRGAGGGRRCGRRGGRRRGRRRCGPGSRRPGGGRRCRARRTAPRAWRSLPSYGAWRVLTPAEPIGRVRCRVPGDVPRAARGQRALVAARRRPAHGRAEVHQHLVPRPAGAGRHERVGDGLDRAAASAAPPPPGPGPGRCWCRRRRRRARRRTPARRAPCTARCPAAPAARRGRRARAPSWRSTISRGGVVEVAGPARVAEALPVPQHVAERRRRARRRRRVGVAERQPLRDHPRRLGLLQHDLGDEDPPRIADRPPRQVAQPGHAPGQHGAGIDARRRVASQVTRSADPHRPGVPAGRPVGRRRRRCSVCSSPSAFVARTRILCSPGRRRPTARTTGPTCCRWRRRRAGAGCHGPSSTCTSTLVMPTIGCHATPAIGCWPASTVAPLRGTSMRDAVLIGPSFDQPRGIQ